MDVTELPDGTHRAGRRELVVLDRGECLRLLGTGVIGRVVYTQEALPAAQPVNYLLDDEAEEVVFRTSGGGKLAAATRNAVIAFEVDEIDLRSRTGWSVLGVGEAYEVTDPVRLADLAGRGPDPWPPLHTTHTIALPLQRLTGRLLRQTTELLPVAPPPDGTFVP